MDIILVVSDSRVYKDILHKYDNVYEHMERDYCLKFENLVNYNIEKMDTDGSGIISLFWGTGDVEEFNFEEIIQTT